MKKLILAYGAISGLVIIVINTLSIELGIAEAWLGFLVMFIAFSSIFVAVKQYRDEISGGVIRFGTAFFLGLGITAIASVVYVLMWELYLVTTDYTFIDVYIQSIVEAQQARGVSEAELAATISETETIRRQYANPLLRIPMTFIEIFPVGVFVSLISAFILKENTILAAE